MEADQILEHLRPLILVVDGFGEMLDVRGGAGDLFGYRPDQMVGHHVLEFVAPSEQASIAGYFVDSADEPLRDAPTPMPFRTVVVDAWGNEHDVDVVPTGYSGDQGDLAGWVITVVPLALQSSPSRSLNAELAGRPRREVRQRLTEELAYPNHLGAMLWFYVDLMSATGPEITAPRHDPGVGPLLQCAIDGGWVPWDLPRAGEEIWPLGRVLVGAGRPQSDLPEQAARALDVIDGNRLCWIPVDLDGEVIGGYLEIARLPAADRDAVKSNTIARVRGLIDVTRMLASRWRDQDRLMLAATRDSLTGLVNRDSFHDALAGADESMAVLYIDVDRFKEVNDRWGHAMGDRVLAQLAERIEGSCRPGDVVARFGGDEFVVLLREVDQATAVRVGERIVAVAGAPLDLPVGPDRVTLSVGLASVVPDLDPVDVADRAMMSAKRLGRGQVVAA